MQDTYRHWNMRVFRFRLCVVFLLVLHSYGGRVSGVCSLLHGRAALSDHVHPAVDCR